MLTGDAMPSWARLVATATIGRPSRVLAYLAVSRTLPAVDVLLVAVLVVQAGVPPPRRLEGSGQGLRRRGLDQRDADVLAGGRRRVQLLVDPGQRAVGVQLDLHLLVRELLDVVHGDP